jgi:S-adenosylmethionine hydrolase
VVVDPGVGSARRPILMEAAGHYFVAPDNGVLSMVFSQEKHKVRLISNERYLRQPVSRTFHGRDIFAPVAAYIAAGARPATVGRIIQDYLRPAFEQPVRSGKHTWNGTILRIDHFGNIITNFRVSDFPDLDRRDFALAIGPHQVTVAAHNYTESGPGELFAIAGSSGYLEVSVRQGSAARLIGCVTGAGVELNVW